MNKIKKIIILFLIMIGVVFINESKAISINYNTLIGYDYDTNPELKYLYCVDHGSPLSAYEDVYETAHIEIKCEGYGRLTKYTDYKGQVHSIVCTTSANHDKGDHYILTTEKVATTTVVEYNYTVKDKIYINEKQTIADGNLARAESNNTTTTNEYNAKLAYILANGQGYSGENNSKTWYTETSTGLKYSQAQMAVYRNWTDFITPLCGAWGNNDTEFGKNKEGENDILKGANDYWGNLQEWQRTGGVFSDNSGTPSTALEKYNEAAYIRVGPIKWTFPGDISSVQITDQEGKEISGLKYKKDNDYSDESGIIESDKAFYILVPTGKGIKEIKANIQLNKNVEIYSAEVVLLEYSGKQCLIQGTGESTSIPGNASVSYSLGVTGELTIIKVDENKNDIKLPNVGFKVQHRATELFVAGSDDNVTYTSNADDARIFITDGEGKFTAKNLVNGYYKVIEVKNPNIYYPDWQDTSDDTYEVRSGAVNSGYDVPNEPDKGDLVINKEDVMYKSSIISSLNSEAVKMGNVGFKLKNKDKGWVQEDKSQKRRMELC